MSSCLEEDYEEEEKVELNETKTGVIQKLKEKDLLRYGALISENDVEYIMGVERSSLGFDKWQLIKLQFREIIKSEGFYITSRGHNDDLYILLPHEMPLHNERKNKANFRNLKQRQRALHMIDCSVLSNEHQKKLEFEILRNASLEIEMASKMKERCRY